MGVAPYQVSFHLIYFYESLSLPSSTARDGGDKLLYFREKRSFDTQYKAATVFRGGSKPWCL